jgi:hypothetical protein
MGCFSTEWARIQHSYLKLNNYPPKKGPAHSGIKAIIPHLLDLVHSVWLCRNKALHGDDATTQLLSYKHTQLLLEIQALYDQSDSTMLAANRSLFTHQYEYWLDKPTPQLQTFLQRMRTIVKVSVAQAVDMGANFRTIDSYFPPTIPQALFDVILGSMYVPYIPPEPDYALPMEGSSPSCNFEPDILTHRGASCQTVHPRKTCGKGHRNVAVWLLRLWTGVNNRFPSLFLFTGTIPEELYDIHPLALLNVGDNLLSGTLDTRIGLLSNLRSLYIFENNFEGTFPT